MKKILHVVILLLSLQQLASAQFKILAEGPAFKVMSLCQHLTGMAS